MYRVLRAYHKPLNSAVEVHRAMGCDIMALDVLTGQVLVEETDPDNEVANNMVDDILRKKHIEMSSCAEEEQVA